MLRLISRVTVCSSIFKTFCSFPTRSQWAPAFKTLAWHLRLLSMVNISNLRVTRKACASVIFYLPLTTEWHNKPGTEMTFLLPTRLVSHFFSCYHRLRAVSYFLQSHWKSIFSAYALTPSENSTDLREKVNC